MNDITRLLGVPSAICASVAKNATRIENASFYTGTNFLPFATLLLCILLIFKTFKLIKEDYIENDCTHECYYFCPFLYYFMEYNTRDRFKIKTFYDGKLASQYYAYMGHVFLQSSYDNVIHSKSIKNLKILYVLCLQFEYI